ncbi:hypothetical protein FOL47_008048 [Perkinsus chesapeaki]|uniref:Kinesin-like protein n=1 Tax=Perkinsus chesapeaki TaxID=330153 RepID=A0A7J6N2P8_PERCH|nr:hypothetical protein FOL47_008048 [Perkinsus chesapeaki]
MLLAKYNYSNSQRTRRLFWVSKDLTRLCWRGHRSGHAILHPAADYQNVSLSEVVAIVHGPKSTTFRKCEVLSDPPWYCFSLLLKDRTLDLAVLPSLKQDASDACPPEFTGEQLLFAWTLGLANLCQKVAPLHRSDVLLGMARMKIEVAASTRGTSYNAHVLESLRCARLIQSPGSSTATSSARGLREDTEGHSGGMNPQLQAENELLRQRLADLASENRSLRETVSTLRGNVRVVVRIRPRLPEESNIPSSVNCSNDNTVVCGMSDGRQRAVQLDAVFAANATQVDVYVGHVRNLVDAVSRALAWFNVLDGYNACVFAYGPTGSGKTYTMFGSANKKLDLGIHEQVLRDIFTAKNGEGGDDITLSISVIEIYNEKIYDLLSPGKSSVKAIVGRSADDVVLEGMVQRTPLNLNESLEMLEAALAARRTASTRLNERSSRSHCVVTIHVTSRCAYVKATQRGKLHLIDLAGSESVSRSGATGDTLREAQLINKSLSTLADVFNALLTRQQKTGSCHPSRPDSTVHVPYRNSKLTLMLKDSLGGNAKALMSNKLRFEVDQVSPSAADTCQTMATLNFASRARMVELGPVRRNAPIS